MLQWYKLKIRGSSIFYKTCKNEKLLAINNHLYKQIHAREGNSSSYRKRIRWPLALANCLFHKGTTMCSLSQNDPDKANLHFVTLTDWDTKQKIPAGLFQLQQHSSCSFWFLFLCHSNLFSSKMLPIFSTQFELKIKQNGKEHTGNHCPKALYDNCRHTTCLGPFSFHRVECKFNRSSLLDPVVLVLLSMLGSFLCFHLFLGNNRKLSHNTLALGLIPNVLAPIEAPID